MGYKIPMERIEEKAKELNVKVLERFSRNHHTYLRIKCLTHLDKPEREVELYNFLNRDKTCGCMLQRYTIEDLKANENLRGDLEIIGEYINNSEPILCKCKICGTEWYITPNKLTQGRGCPSCYSRKLSAGERYIINILSKNNIPFIHQKKFDNLRNPITNCFLKFDFFLPEYNLCIEYQGQQHYKPIYFGKKEGKTKEEIEKLAQQNLKNTQYRDEIKRKYCEDNNIKYLEIPYYSQSQLEEIILNQIKIRNDYRVYRVIYKLK